MIDVPGVVRAKADAAGAPDWVDGLPALVAGLERDWSITVGRTYGDATEAFVAEATRADGVMMREDPVDLLASDPWDRAHDLASRTNTDAVAIWEWGVVERVSTGLLGTEIGLQPIAGEMLQAAEVIADTTDR